MDQPYSMRQSLHSQGMGLGNGMCDDEANMIWRMLDFDPASPGLPVSARDGAANHASAMKTMLRARCDTYLGMPALVMHKTLIESGFIFVHTDKQPGQSPLSVYLAPDCGLLVHFEIIHGLARHAKAFLALRDPSVPISQSEGVFAMDASQGLLLRLSILSRFKAAALPWPGNPDYALLRISESHSDLNLYEMNRITAKRFLDLPPWAWSALFCDNSNS